MPLYLDSGASTHILCVHLDFSEFTPIEPCTIMGVSNSAVSVIGMGTIEILLLKSSVCLVLWNILYAPEAGIRLISISWLDDSGHWLSFANSLCTMFNQLTGRKLAECACNLSHLYVFLGSIHSPFIPSTSTSPCIALPSLVLTPNLETWHHCLGHANFQTMLDMARGELTTGMQVNLALTPQACVTCIHGKQTHHCVPNLHEGQRAERCLGYVFVDLTGPQTVSACSGCLYIMNIINNYWVITGCGCLRPKQKCQANFMNGQWQWKPSLGRNSAI